MHRFVIERNFPGAGKLDQAQLREIATKSCDVLKRMGTAIQWVRSYVTDDKIDCVYLAENPEQLRRHAAAGNFPSDSIARVRTIIDPTTAG
ncbi:MAG: DUF4242 domain-containing protein [Betaproteobacteria bacterium]